MKTRIISAALAAGILAAACDAAGPGGIETVARVDVAPAAVELQAGAGAQLAAIPRTAGGRALNGRGVTWTVSDSSVARVSAGGAVTALRAGVVTASASIDGAQGTATVRVTTNPAPLASTLTPSSAAARTTPLTVVITGSGFVPDAEVLWNGAPRPTMYVDAGELRATLGAADLQAEATAQVEVRNPGPGGGTSPGVMFTISPAPVATLTISPSELDLFAHESVQLRVQLLDAAGRVLNGRPVAWTTSDASIAAVSTEGRVTALRSGVAFVTAASETRAATVTVRVEPPRGPALRIDHDTLDVQVGDTARVRAFAYDAAGQPVPQPDIVWNRLDNGTDFSGYGAFGSPRDSIRVRGREIGIARLEASTSNGLRDTLVVRIRGIADRIRSVEAGGFLTCGLDDAQRAFCWGTTYPHLATYAPAPVGSSIAFRSISAGHTHACGIAQDSRVWCWYDGSLGQLGAEVPLRTPTPVLAAGGRTFASLTAGGWHTCALDADGTAWCWGANSYGQLGDGSREARPGPVQVSGNLRFTTLVAGGYHTCGTTADGRLYCWGNNVHGQSGPEADDCRTDTGVSYCASRPNEMSTALRFMNVAVGGRHTCALTADGAAHCWGDGMRGQLGNGTTGYSREPVAVAGSHRFVRISAGFGNTCGITAAGGLYCWGQNDYGNNGVSRAASEGCIQDATLYFCNRTPVAVSGGLTFSEFSTGWYHTCGVTASRTSYCWGSNSTGEAGVGSSGGEIATPTRVRDGSVATAGARVSSTPIELLPSPRPRM